MMQVYDIHISDVLAFKSCRRRWDFSSMLRRNLTPVRLHAPFFTGRVIHAALDQLYHYGLDPLEALPALVDEETRELREKFYHLYQADLPLIESETELCRGILAHYLQWRNADSGRYADRNLDFLNVEQLFNVRMRTNRGYIARRFRKAGRLDGVVRAKLDDQLYLWEVKTTQSITQRIKMLDLEEQADSYMLDAQELLGEPIAGAIYTIIRKKIPDKPEVLKRGRLTQNKQLDTTFEYYLAAIRELHGHNASRQFIQDTYGDFLQHLLDNGKPFFTRVLIRRTPEQLNNARNELYAVAREMTNPHIPIYHHGQPSCNWCIYREPCLALQAGDRALSEQLLANNYRANTYHLGSEEDV